MSVHFKKAPVPALQTAYNYILLRDTPDGGESLLSEALLPPQSRKVSADQSAHMDGRKLTPYTF
jgi:hypothetical protein